jgi:hypothetical protein
MIRSYGRMSAMTEREALMLSAGKRVVDEIKGGSEGWFARGAAYGIRKPMNFAAAAFGTSNPVLGAMLAGAGQIEKLTGLGDWREKRIAEGESARIRKQTEINRLGELGEQAREIRIRLGTPEQRATQAIAPIAEMQAAGLLTAEQAQRAAMMAGAPVMSPTSVAAPVAGLMR